MLSKEVSLMVLVSFVLACIIAWLGINRFLQDFAYRPVINVGIFVLAGLVSYLLAFITMGIQILKVAVANPAVVLKNDN